MVNLSHLFYADDAIFLGQWSELNIDSLVRVLDCFFRASGLRINMCKSKIMGVNVEDGMVKNAASKLGCLVLKTPFTYLGTKVGGNMSRKQAWKEVVDKVLSRLSRWKMKLLSIGGRLTLLKSVLGSMPIFHMSIFKVPSSILKSLESIRSRFFNGQDPKSNKASWVKWNKKCSLWTKVIKAIYGEDGNLNKDVSGGVRTCWTSIVHEVRVLQGRGINVADYIRLKLGNGENTRFWVDNWYEGGVIKELFPQKLEEMQLNSLAEISRMTTLVPCEDRYVWTLESDGVFSVASQFRKEMWESFQDVSCRLGGLNPYNSSVESTKTLFFLQCVVVRTDYGNDIFLWNIDYSDVNFICIPLSQCLQIKYLQMADMEKEIVKGKSKEIDLPVPKVDIIISEWTGDSWKLWSVAMQSGGCCGGFGYNGGQGGDENLTRRLLSVFSKAATDDVPIEISDYLSCKNILDIFRGPVITPSGLAYERVVILDNLEKVFTLLAFSFAHQQK
ncbi:hypothetical protein Tco_0819473 [Tanacetum coccineum]|uniref:RNA-directed DNA polymerase, eukaryota, reverse transcriptase zinc-binding domain protein n=1 Tax=Tanacetum coccineum TaxID=301880 RepID=A0ABQ5AB12_9ASTR